MPGRVRVCDSSGALNTPGISMPAPRAVLFDMDGTLLEPLEDGLPEFKRRWGIPGEELVVEFLTTLEPSRRAEVEREFAGLEARGASQSELRPGIRGLLEELRRGGVRLAMVTNNRRSSAATVLSKHTLIFDAVLTREDAAPKPAPEMILRALSILDVEPQAAVLVGDALVDILAARSAGLKRMYLLTTPPAALAARPGSTGPPARNASNGDTGWGQVALAGNGVTLVGSVDDLARELSSDGLPGLAES